MLLQLSIGLILGATIGIAAWRLRALSLRGAWAATMIGGLIFGLGGFSWAFLLLTFFISSSFLSRLLALRKTSLDGKYSKGSQRDAGQVFANGGLGVLLVLVHLALPDQFWPWIAYAGSLAAVNADTWATELGVMNPKPPRLITTGVIVEMGTSGGVSLWGYYAAFGGSLLIAVFTALFTDVSQPVLITLTIVFAGLAGSTVDSLLGATIQAIYYCDHCQKSTERHPLHSCGQRTRRLRGWKWLSNDWVNFFCSMVGAVVAVLGLLVIR